MTLGPSDRDREANQRTLQVATLGAGCFWCLDALARRTPGVVSSIVGYGGGPGPAPTYWDLHRPDGPVYVETVQLEFDVAIIDFRGILDLFFQVHDPTTPNQDGANRGPEYHSTIFFHSREQQHEAEEAIADEEARLGRPVITSVVPFTTFFRAEPEHQDFFTANPTHPYCTFVIRPKLENTRGRS
jgi:peptide-methionine (S)-S-oxide reductase